MKRWTSIVLTLVALAALAAGCSNKAPRATAEQAAGREAITRAAQADAGDSSWTVSNTDEIIYVDGFTLIQHEPSADSVGRGFRWMGQRGRVRLKTHGDRPMRLFMYGWANIKILQTTPTITAFIDGRPVANSTPPHDTGLWGVDVIVPAEYLAGRDWVELTVTSSTIAWPWIDAKDVSVIAFNFLSWTEKP